MKEFIWLTRSVITAMHQELLARFGGLAGIRDEGLLESALARAEHLHAYGDPVPSNSLPPMHTGL